MCACLTSLGFRARIEPYKPSAIGHMMTCALEAGDRVPYMCLCTCRSANEAQGSHDDACFGSTEISSVCLFLPRACVQTDKPANVSTGSPDNIVCRICVCLSEFNLVYIQTKGPAEIVSTAVPTRSRSVVQIRRFQLRSSRARRGKGLRIDDDRYVAERDPYVYGGIRRLGDFNFWA